MKLNQNKKNKKNCRTETVAIRIEFGYHNDDDLCAV